MSKRAAHRARDAARMATHVARVSETITDSQQIAAAMEDTVEVVSEEVPAPSLADEARDLYEELTGRVLPRAEGRDVAGKPSTPDLEDALAQLGLEPSDVIGWRGFVPEQESVLVTAGGVKLHWPQDIDRVLTDAEKGRTPPQPTGEAGGEGRFAREGGAFKRD